MFSNHDFGQRLKYIRKAAGLTQDEVSLRLSIDRSTYAYYELGKTTPTYSTLLYICDMFNLNVGWLLTGEGETFKPKK